MIPCGPISNIVTLQSRNTPGSVIARATEIITSLSLNGFLNFVEGKRLKAGK